MADGEPLVEIDRRLLKEDATARAPTIIEQQRIADFKAPVVILGDPGLGKSILAQAIGRWPGFVYIRAASFVRNAHPERLIPNGECLVIDGLDEIASATVGGGIDAILSQLSRLGYPRFILSSREVDWRGAADRIKIEDDYGQPTILLHLLTFDRADATLFLQRAFPNVEAEPVLDHLADRGLEEIYKNPLTLRLIGEVADSEGALPSSRAQLLDRACRLLVREDNPRHQDAAHAHAETEKLLLAAGAYAAAHLLCDISGLFNGPSGSTPDGCVHYSSTAALPLAEAIEPALHTRLFEAEGTQRFHILHRVIAEYLGAKWLAHCFKSGVSARRLFSLFGHGQGVPTSLRGLHAWLAHFDDTLAEVCVAADPYAVLRYGDAETMPFHIARRLLASLAALSERDPFFRAEDWGRHPASGLMRRELKDDILALIGNPDQHTHLTLLLVEAMAGSQLTAVLEPELRTMMFDRARYFGERSRAADALREFGKIDDPEYTIERLLAQGGEDDRQLAWELLHDVGIGAVPMELAIRTLYAHIGVTVSNVDRKADRLDLAHLSDSSIEALDLNQLCSLLDAARDYGEPLLKNGNDPAKAQVADLVRLAGLRALTLAPDMAPADVWRRLHWVDHNQGYKRETTAALSEWFSVHQDVRRAIQEHAVFDAGYEHIRDASYAFYQCGLNLYPNEDDVIALIEAFDRRRAGKAVDVAMLEELVLLSPRREGISAAVCAAATKLGAGSPEFMAKLAQLSKPIVYDWDRKQKVAAKRAEKRRAKVHQSYRDSIAKDLPSVDAGAPNLLYDPAKAYLGRYSDFNREAPPETRVIAFLGDELGDRVLNGFMASLCRNDHPSAQEIVETHLADKIFFAELSLICGIAERLRRGLGLDDLTVDAREAAFMAWRRTTESQIAGGTDMKPLEAAVLCNDEAIERFFRTSIEPQLEHKAGHVHDLYFLGNHQRWQPLAGRLAIEWLRRFPLLPKSVEAELLNYASRRGELKDLTALAREARGRVHRDYETMLSWLSLDFLVDFEGTFDHLVNAAADDRDFLWYIRNRFSGERGDAERKLSVPQRQFIVERFGAAWPKTPRPQGTSRGDTSPWDATAMIETSLYAIGGDPSRDATASLEHLIVVADPSYVHPLRHALALQLRARRDSEFTPVSAAGLLAVVGGGLPSTIDDMRAFLGDRIIAVNDKMHATSTDMWEAYWDDAKPRGENFCRNRLIEHISGQLPEPIRFAPEMHMPQQKRADIAAIFGSIGLPVEIKGQWHPGVWTAPTEQLAARYLRDWHAEGRGVYIVLWFGHVAGKNLPTHPDGLPRPETPDALRTMLIDRLPNNLRDVIDVYVVDVSREKIL